MKNNNVYLVGGALLLIGGGYIAYKKGLFGAKVEEDTTKKDIVDAQKEKEIEEGLIIEAKKKKARTTTIENPNSFKAKVAVIQGKLGVAMDGVVGAQTRMALNDKFPSVTDLTPSNIDSVTAMFNGSATAKPTISKRLPVGKNVIANIPFMASAIMKRVDEWLTTDENGTAFPTKTFKKSAQVGEIARYLGNDKLIIRLSNPIVSPTRTFIYIVVKDSWVK
jgi:hypothetical protein